ncbi:MAG: RnfABCDGE type electron transport complex subunit D [Firmicutes bacterium]|jgi:electron transport complex protein RnfD|nr:RnfABCDGE type electron transport complex subunit D [Bacillota bacterium]HQD39843.1 RnfABCDGE type electron transport complex subunit D [Bacillota bacterium]
MDKLKVTPPPHLHSGDQIRFVMRDVLVALIPACLAAIYFFGWRALLMLAVGTGSAVFWEWLLVSKEKKTIGDLSAAVTGMLLTLVLPPSLPLWLIPIGTLIAIGLGKLIFGGLGYNPFNPALIGRAALMASWPAAMTSWFWPKGASLPLENFNALTTATPLVLAKYRGFQVGYSQLFWGNVAGSLGETSAFAILLGAAYLIIKRRIDLRIPLSYLATVFILMAIWGRDPVFHLLAGGLLLGAFFMATDYVTTPVTPRGRIVFGIGCGILTVLIRLFGGYPEGVNYSILLMNALSPLLERWTMPVPGRRSSRA